ncbi:TonB-dependent receptor [Olleya sp. UBA1516]|uniref:TonB-dependent receptor n=1 Tax=Olleya sp. UBA1516 TaxID=1947013 RepID=UPI0025F1AF40|nr:TonB-dependent receptor [Olleya sp. UBA1516]|tara:strand:- start:324 stop:2054 length:1731 start_codon:yes stop_codon:yes gene_type:complete
MFSTKKQIILTIASLLITVFAFAQEREGDTIQTGVIDVVKPYTPSISDAFKVKETPTLDDTETATKKEVKYNIFSFPVASTFTPAKGKAAVVDKAKKVKLYDNYATLGVGTYTTIVGEAYLNHAIGRDQIFSAYVGHHSSQGDIENVLTDSGFSDSKLNLTYTKKDRDYSWTALGGFQYQTYNWYGLQQPLFNQATADSLDVGHSFINGYVGGDITFEDAIVSSGSVLYRRFGDNFGSGENRFKANAIGTINIQDNDIDIEVFTDYIGGSFDKAYADPNQINYGNFQIGLAPTFQLKQDDLTVDLGVKAVYLNDTEASKSKFFIYPNIAASYRLVDEVLIAFGGVTGGLNQNSYYDFAQENPFVSPNLFIAPTDQQYKAFAGIKGKLSNTMSYSVSGNYYSEKNKALYTNNDITTTSEPYTFGNSFSLVYDDVTTFSFAGELNVDINRNFTLGIKGEYFSYDVTNQMEAWNLPDLTASVFLDYQITDQWFAGANLFFVGERKDQFNIPNLISPNSGIVTLDSYFDANAHVGYHINDRFSVFAKANNIVGEEYTKWQNTPVQGIQFLAGATYKFDFQ